jgi:hypothetical protein
MLAFSGGACSSDDKGATASGTQQGATGFWHYCAEVVPDHDYEYITIAANGRGGIGVGYVNIDDLRFAAYDFATRFAFVTSLDCGIPNCAHLPLDTPFF